MIRGKPEDISEYKDGDLHLEHGAEGGPGVGGGRGGPEPDHGATGAGTLAAKPNPPTQILKGQRAGAHAATLT